MNDRIVFVFPHNVELSCSVWNISPMCVVNNVEVTNNYWTLLYNNINLCIQFICNVNILYMWKFFDELIISFALVCDWIERKRRKKSTQRKLNTSNKIPFEWKKTNEYNNIMNAYLIYTGFCFLFFVCWKQLLFRCLSL